MKTQKIKNSDEKKIGPFTTKKKLHKMTSFSASLPGPSSSSSLPSCAMAPIVEGISVTVANRSHRGAEEGDPAAADGQQGGQSNVLTIGETFITQW